jgi:DNA-binding MarR family transcriptional regulator
MGKNFETKRTILKSLIDHRRTLTDISNQMGLSPSTVKQHLQELSRMGLVRFVDDAHLHHYKYYELVPYMTLERCGITENGRRIVKPMVVG